MSNHWGDNVTPLRDYLPESKRRDGDDGGNGGGSGMEERLRAVEQKVEVMASNYATKADVSGLEAEIHKSANSIIKWMVGTMLGAAGVASAIGFGLSRLMA